MCGLDFYASLAIGHTPYNENCRDLNNRIVYRYPHTVSQQAGNGAMAETRAKSRARMGLEGTKAVKRMKLDLYPTDMTVKEEEKEVNMEQACQALPDVMARDLVVSLTSLPNELIHKICAFLSIRDRLCLRLVNRQLYTFCSSPYLWTNVAINDVSHQLDNPLYIKAVLKASQPHVQYLSIKGQIPFSHYQSLILSCKMIKALNLYGFEITINALQKIVTSLPHLQYLTLTHTKCKSVKTLTKAVFSSLSFLKKLAIVLKDETSNHVQPLMDLWLELNCFPTQFHIINISETWHKSHISDVITPSIDHSAHFSVYDRYQRPLNLPFYDQPIYSLQCGPVEHLCTSVNGELQVELCDVVTPTGHDQSDVIGQFGIVKQMSLSDELPVSYSQHGSSVTVLVLAKVTITPESLSQILQETPNLQELNMKRCIVTDVVDAYLVPLPEYCQKLSSLNIAHIVPASTPTNRKAVVLDTEHLWYLLSMIRSLECLTVTSCSLLPPIAPAALAGEGRISNIPSVNAARSRMEVMADYMSRMSQLRALSVIACKRMLCQNCGDPISAKLIAQHSPFLVSKLKYLHYLQFSLPLFGNTVYLHEVFQNCKQLSVLRAHCGISQLPTDPTLYAHLTHLYITNGLSIEFIKAISDAGSLKHFLYEGPAKGEVMKKLIHSCNFVTCYVYTNRFKDKKDLYKQAKKKFQNCKFSNYCPIPIEATRNTDFDFLHA